MRKDVFSIVNILADNSFVENVDEEFSDRLTQLLKKIDIDEEFSLKLSEETFYVIINGYRSYDDLDKFLGNCFSEFKEIAIKTNLLKNKLFQSEISRQIFLIRSDLQKLLDSSKAKRYSNLTLLVHVKIVYCDKLLDFISNIKTEVFKLKEKKSGTYTELTQKQIVILFHHLHDLGYVGKGMQNDELAGLISQITAFSADKIRQDLSLVKKDSRSVESYEFKDTDYDAIVRAIKKLLKRIETEQKEKFSSI